jgi:hypothetical protein
MLIRQGQYDLGMYSRTRTGPIIAFVDFRIRVTELDAKNRVSLGLLKINSGNGGYIRDITLEFVLLVVSCQILTMNPWHFIP